MAKVGRKAVKIKIEDVIQYARLGLTMNEIASCLGIGAETLYDKCRKKPEFSEAIKQGRAELVAKSASVILEAAIGRGSARKLIDPKTNEVVVVPAVPPDPRMALEVARRFGGAWKDTPIIEQFNFAATGDKASENAAKLGDDAMTRMASAWLRSRGVTVE
jgi:hypothetical protein